MRTHSLKGVQKAESFLSRLGGLMGKQSWPQKLGGLYFPRCASVHTFFTFLRPDVVFTDKNNRILKIIPQAGPWRFWFGPRGSENCLEIPPGLSRKSRLQVGMKLVFPGLRRV